MTIGTVIRSQRFSDHRSLVMNWKRDTGASRFPLPYSPTICTSAGGAIPAADAAFATLIGMIFVNASS